MLICHFISGIILSKFDVLLQIISKISYSTDIDLLRDNNWQKWSFMDPSVSLFIIHIHHLISLIHPIPNMWSYLCYLQKVAHWPTICFATFAKRCLIYISVFTYKRNMQMNPTFISVSFIYIKTLHIEYAIRVIILFWNLIMHLWR